MPNPDGYSSPVDFRITSNPQPVLEQKSRYNFEELYDFSRQVILTFVRYLGVGTYDTSYWSDLSLDPSQLLFEGNLNKIYVTAKVAITAGQYINLFNDAGVLKAQLATGAAGTPLWADGFCNGNVAAGSTGEFILNRGINPWISGLTIGQRLWLGLTAGGLRTTPPTGAGQLEQYIGQAVSPNRINTNIMYPIQH